ncbi:fluoride efflux transporter CrcB [Virgibacillus alimentarius]|uniref:fluoride efflux transporter CrcB n=1 Tax=Virgibacillus alimentarius TaxID=698769 RepID=UPI00049315B6|nr:MULTISPECIES: fluoride efflux transporter CrcB [Virgibacillus]HLR69187.1 fluoride efflux transporter CrcB [Virgibacillus sp.]
MIWFVGLGGSLGAAARFLLGTMLNKYQDQIPIGTWMVNVTGSFLLGGLARLYLTNQVDDWVWFFWGVGFCGAYTTFSTFGYETIHLIQSNQLKAAIIYVTSSVIVSVIVAAIGLSVFR